MKKEENLEKQVKELEKSNRWMKGILLSLIGIFLWDYALDLAIFLEIRCI